MRKTAPNLVLVVHHVKTPAVVHLADLTPTAVNKTAKRDGMVAWFRAELLVVLVAVSNAMLSTSLV